MVYVVAIPNFFNNSSEEETYSKLASTCYSTALTEVVFALGHYRVLEGISTDIASKGQVLFIVTYLIILLITRTVFLRE